MQCSGDARRPEGCVRQYSATNGDQFITGRVSVRTSVPPAAAD
jgi:hypothetical protein